MTFQGRCGDLYLRQWVRTRVFLNIHDASYP